MVVNPEQPSDPGDRDASVAKLKSLRRHSLIDRRHNRGPKLNNQRQGGRGSRPLRFASPRMTAEADASFTGGTLTADSLRTLDVTHRVALETLRMYPIAPAITRTVSNTFEFAGYTIPAGEKVIVATTVPHHLEQYFPEPERFDIERYTPERQEHRQPGVFAPFGAGPHVCLGPDSPRSRSRRPWPPSSVKSSSPSTSPTTS